MVRLIGELYSCLPLRGQTDGGVVFMSSPAKQAKLIHVLPAGSCIHVFPCVARLMGELYSCVPLYSCGQTDRGVVFLSSPAWPD